jgi:hypothetical protein
VAIIEHGLERRNGELVSAVVHRCTLEPGYPVGSKFSEPVIGTKKQLVIYELREIVEFPQGPALAFGLLAALIR